jgi:hypothetical protein
MMQTVELQIFANNLSLMPRRKLQHPGSVPAHTLQNSNHTP